MHPFKGLTFFNTKYCVSYCVSATAHHSGIKTALAAKAYLFQTLPKAYGLRGQAQDIRV
jgi:hypothetical protein